MFTFTCKDCENRHIGCHSTCEKYNRERDENEKIKKKIEEEKKYFKYKTETVNKKYKNKWY